MSKLFKFVAIGGALTVATTVGALEDVPAVPSGFSLTLQETLLDSLQDGTTALRLRFVAPQIAQGTGYAAVAEDFAVLCEQVAVPGLAATGQNVDQVIVSLSDRKTEFGVANPQATQYFEVFTLKDDTCIWEAF